jgi:hypothetical protein
MKTGRGNGCTRRKPVPLQLPQPKIPHGLTYHRTWAAMLGNRRITTWVMARTRRLLRTLKLKLSSFNHEATDHYLYHILSSSVICFLVNLTHGIQTFTCTKVNIFNDVTSTDELGNLFYGSLFVRNITFTSLYVHQWPRIDLSVVLVTMPWLHTNFDETRYRRPPLNFIEVPDFGFVLLSFKSHCT